MVNLLLMLRLVLFGGRGGDGNVATDAGTDVIGGVVVSVSMLLLMFVL